MMANRETLIEDCELMYQTLSDTAELDARIAALNDEIAVVAEMVKSQVQANAHIAQPQSEYESKRAVLIQRYEKAVAELDQRTDERTLKISKGKRIRIFIDSLRDQPLVLEQ